MATTINADNGAVSGSAGLKYSSDSTGVLALQTNGTTAVSISTGQVVTLTNALAEASGGTGTTVGYNGFKNRIINGAMVIDQRNAGGSITANDDTYAVDRFKTTASQSSKLTAQRNAGSVTPPAGFSNYLGYTSSSAYSIGTSDYFVCQQSIEGFNIADLAWGTASAASVTLSFWVRSSLTGTFGGSLRNSDASRSYPFTYTISAANTWEYETITIAGDTSGTWGSTNGIGISLGFGLGVGSTVSGTAGAWAGANYRSATGATSVVGTNGATFYITGVQLEKGSTATSFDYRPFTTELQLCQRYFEKSYNTDVAVATSTDTGTVSTKSPQADMQDTIQFAVEKRSGPDIVYYTGLGVINNWRDVSAGSNKGMNTAATGSRQFTWANSAGMTVGNVLRGHWTASVEL
jgi:hypothetical protein